MTTKKTRVAKDKRLWHCERRARNRAKREKSLVETNGRNLNLLELEPAGNGQCDTCTRSYQWLSAKI